MNEVRYFPILRPYPRGGSSWRPRCTAASHSPVHSGQAMRVLLTGHRLPGHWPAGAGKGGECWFKDLQRELRGPSPFLLGSNSAGTHGVILGSWGGPWLGLQMLPNPSSALLGEPSPQPSTGPGGSPPRMGLYLPDQPPHPIEVPSPPPTKTTFTPRESHPGPRSRSVGALGAWSQLPFSQKGPGSRWTP